MQGQQMFARQTPHNDYGNEDNTLRSYVEDHSDEEAADSGHFDTPYNNN